MSVERWKLMADWIMPAHGRSPQPLTVVIGPQIPPGQRIEVVPAERLREAVNAARTFNRGGMTWLEYDAALVRFERIANGVQSIETPPNGQERGRDNA
jgi:hypothetical protein